MPDRNQNLDDRLESSRKLAAKIKKIRRISGHMKLWEKIDLKEWNRIFQITLLPDFPVLVFKQVSLRFYHSRPKIITYQLI